MSHRALIAERQQNKQFNLYHSRNGAEQIQLLDGLRESLNVDGRVDWDALTGQTAPGMLRDLTSPGGARVTVESGDTGNIVEPEPVVENVRQEEILQATGLLNYEVLYVVDDGTVTAYWLAWTYPDVIRPWAAHIEAEVYQHEQTPDTIEELVDRIENAKPLRTLDDFEQGWLSDAVAREVVRDYHRWLYELQSMAGQTIEGTDSEADQPVQQHLQSPEYEIRFQANAREPLVPQGHPFVIPIRIGTPPNASSIHIQESAAQIRFNIGAALHAADQVSEPDVRQAHADVLVQLIEAHGSAVAAEFIPGKLETVVEACQQTSGQQGLDNVWR